MANLTHLTISVRGYDADIDKNIIISSWAHQVRACEPLKQLSADEFRLHMQRCLKSLSENIVLVACNNEHKEQVYGWLCGNKRDAKNILHFVYVRKTWRQQGIASTLLRLLCPRTKEEDIYITHQSRGTKHFVERWKLIFNPYLF